MITHDNNELYNSRATIQPQHHGIRNVLCIRFKEPKHGHSSTITIVGGKQTSIHISFKQGIGWLDLFEAVDSKVLGFGHVVVVVVVVVVFVGFMGMI
jgi:hypothetical protein